jgi:hypothetical protein
LRAVRGGLPRVAADSAKISLAGNVYYTLQVEQVGLRNSGKWRLSLIQCAADAAPVRLHLERFFDS